MKREEQDKLEVKQSPADIFLKQLESKEIKLESLSMGGGQSNCVILTDEKKKESYVITLPKWPFPIRNLQGSVALRELLYQPEFSHPCIIEFLPFKGRALIEELTKHYADPFELWHRKWEEHNALQNFVERSLLLEDKALAEYPDLFYNIACSKKFEGLTLAEMLNSHKNSEISQKEFAPFILIILQKLISAVLHIYLLKYTHRDVSANNVLFNKMTMELKLIDINIVHECDEKGMFFLSKDRDGTSDYIAPEILTLDAKQSGYFDAAVTDSFSIGVILYQLLAGKYEVNIFNVPPAKASKKQKKLSYKNSLSQRYDVLMKKTDQEFKAEIDLSLRRDKIKIDEPIKNLLIGLLQLNPAKRLKIFDIFLQPCFTDLFSKINVEMYEAYNVASKAGNQYIARILEKSYPEMTFMKIFKEEITPYLKLFCTQNSYWSLSPLASFALDKNSMQILSYIDIANSIIEITEKSFSGTAAIDNDLIKLLTQMLLKAIKSNVTKKSDKFYLKMHDFIHKLFEPRLRMLIKNEILPYLNKIARQPSGFSLSQSSHLKNDIRAANGLISVIKNYIQHDIDKSWLEEIDRLLITTIRNAPGKNSPQFCKEMEKIHQEFSQMQLRFAPELGVEQKESGFDSRSSSPCSSPGSGSQ